MSGDLQQSLGRVQRIGKVTISKMFKETTNPIWEDLKKAYSKPPQEAADWKTTSKEFENL